MGKLPHYSDVIKQVITEYATTRKLVNDPNTEFQLIFDTENLIEGDFTISFTAAPEAKSSRINSTLIRVSLMMGLPPKILGLVVMCLSVSMF